MSRQGPVPETAELRIEHVAIGKLRPDPFNPRRISEAEMEALVRSVREFGLLAPILVRKEDKTVVAGHQRLQAARRLGLETVPVIFVDISVEQAKLLNLALNKISGDWDEGLLGRLMADLRETPDVDISLSGFSEDEVAKLLRTLDARERRDRPETFDLEAAWEAATKDPGVQRGDVWRLGDHRLMCGDSAHSGDVSRLMAGQQATLMVTDPPYGVAYEPEGRKRKRRIANDDLGKDQAEFWTKSFSAWPLEGDAYVFSPSGPLIQTLSASIVAAGIAHHQWLIWSKDQFVLGRSHYHYKHEHIFYGWRGKSSWNGSRVEESVWNEDRPMRSPQHPTMKPVSLCVRAIENSSQPNDLVIDLFLGSGTTLIAAERTGRRCYGMELDPHYCALVIARWETFTGEEAEKVSE